MTKTSKPAAAGPESFITEESITRNKKKRKQIFTTTMRLKYGHQDLMFFMQQKLLLKYLKLSMCQLIFLL